MEKIEIERTVAVHEAGHLVIGLILGIDEQGVVFRPLRPDEGAQAWNRKASDRQMLVRAFAGILAHLLLLPESFPPGLKNAYNHSVIFTPQHPYFHLILPEDREFLSGAATDLAHARCIAAAMHPGDSSAADKCLMDAEREARALVQQHLPQIERVVADIHTWAAEPDRQFDVMLLYPPQRAKAMISTSPSG